MRILVFDAGPFVLLFTDEVGSDRARKAVIQHEEGKISIYIHPNNLSESYRVIDEIRREKPELLTRDVEPRTVVRSAYSTLNVFQDEKTTINLGRLKAKYRAKPWGDLSSAALALTLSNKEKVPVVILDGEKHFEDLEEVASIRISDLKL